MDRREFLSATRTKNKISVPSTPVGRTSSGLNPYTGPWTANEVAHLLKRTMFGATKADLVYFSGKSMTQAVDELLNPVASMPAPPVKEYTPTGATTPDTNIAMGTTWVNDPNTDGNVNNSRKDSLKSWWMGVMLNQDRSVREKLTLFWHNHFSTQTETVANAAMLYKHYNLLRTSCLGNFKSLVRAVTIDPNMLDYLNGQYNTKGAPDENYARELQELFTLGKENNPNYSEGDVQTAARVLTGWRIDTTTLSAYFDETKHDNQDKTFSSFYSNTTITGQSGPTGGDLELDALMNMIFSRGPEVSTFIVKKLYRWFVYYEIDAAAEANVIAPLAALFQSSNWDIKPVLDALFKSEHFFDVLNQACLIKSPVDFAIGLCREFQVQFPDSSDPSKQYGMWDFILNWVRVLQQDVGDPPNVSGWPAYYQIPMFHEIWINSDTYPKRNQFSDTLVYLGYTRAGQTLIIDPVAFTKTLTNPGDPNVLITEALGVLYRISFSQAARDQVKTDILLSGQTNDYYWTNAWNAYIANPSDMMALQAVYTRLRDLYKYFMNLAEYHLS